MPVTSIWDYLRQRARDAVLSGFNDALDVIEQDDQGRAQFEAAKKLRDRLGNAPAAERDGPLMLQAAASAENGTPGQGRAAASVRPEPGTDAIDDLIGARLDATPAPVAPGNQPHPNRRKRGRPRKDEVR